MQLQKSCMKEILLYLTLVTGTAPRFRVAERATFEAGLRAQRPWGDG
jgi:hypothetical protein